jgi:hypothetical protein
MRSLVLVGCLVVGKGPLPLGLSCLLLSLATIVPAFPFQAAAEHRTQGGRLAEGWSAPTSGRPHHLDQGSALGEAPWREDFGGCTPVGEGIWRLVARGREIRNRSRVSGGGMVNRRNLPLDAALVSCTWKHAESLPVWRCPAKLFNSMKKNNLWRARELPTPALPSRWRADSAPRDLIRMQEFPPWRRRMTRGPHRSCRSFPRRRHAQIRPL